MNGARGFTLLECLVAMSVLGCMMLFVLPVVVHTAFVREQLFQHMVHLMHYHVVVSSLAADIRRGPSQVDQWDWDDDGISWRGSEVHTWRCRRRRLWFYEGGIPTAVGDDIDLLSGIPVVYAGRVVGVWIRLGSERCMATWYIPVYEGLL